MTSIFGDCTDDVLLAQLNMAGLGVSGINPTVDPLLVGGGLTVAGISGNSLYSGSGISNTSFTNQVTAILNILELRTANTVTRANRASRIIAFIRSTLGTRNLTSAQRQRILSLLTRALNRGRIAGQIELLVDTDLVAAAETANTGANGCTVTTTTNCGCAVATPYVGF